MIERAHSLPCDGGTAEDAVWSDVEHLVDTTGCSYDDAWQRFGMLPDDLVSARVDDSDENYGEYYRELIRRGWTNKAKKEKQRVINQRGAEMARAALRRIKKTPKI